MGRSPENSRCLRCEEDVLSDVSDACEDFVGRFGLGKRIAVSFPDGVYGSDSYCESDNDFARCNRGYRATFANHGQERDLLIGAGTLLGAETARVAAISIDRPSTCRL